MSLILRGFYQRLEAPSRRLTTAARLRQDRAIDNSVTDAIDRDLEWGSE